MPLALAPVDQQVLAEEHGDDHAQAIVHPAGVQQLAHGGIDDRKTGAALFPGLEVGGRIAPGQGLGVGAEGAVPRDLWITVQDVFVELSPEQLVDPGLDADAAAVELAPVAGQRRVQALSRRDHPGGQVGGQLAGAGLGGQVAQVLVILDRLVEKTREARVGFCLAGRPVVAQGVGGFVETVHLLRDRVAGDVQWRLGFYSVG
ncbi:hypothetical protein D3C79_544210 [compost metagenome]